MGTSRGPGSQRRRLNWESKAGRNEALCCLPGGPTHAVRALSHQIMPLSIPNSERTITLGIPFFNVQLPGHDPRIWETGDQPIQGAARRLRRVTLSCSPLVCPRLDSLHQGRAIVGAPRIEPTQSRRHVGDSEARVSPTTTRGRLSLREPWGPRLRQNWTGDVAPPGAPSGQASPERPRPAESLCCGRMSRGPRDKGSHPSHRGRS